MTIRTAWAVVMMFVAAFAAAAMLGCDPAGSDTVAPPPEVPVNVVVREVVPAALPDAVLLPATVEPSRSVTIPAEVAGRIEERVEEGVPVAEGQVITHIDPRTLQAEADQAEANYSLAQSDFKRAENLLAQKTISAEQFDQAKAQLAVARARLDAAQVALAKGTVKSPIAGVLNKRMVEAGEYVSPGDPIARVVLLDPVKVVVDIPEKDIQFVQMGSAMGVTVEGVKEMLPAQVTYRSVVADPATLTFRVELTVPNPQARLLPGMIVEVALLRRVIENAITVPLFAVVPRDGRAVVYVVDGAVARERTITLGVTDGERILVTGGLAAGDMLVVEGQRQLSDGQAVSVVEGVGTAVAAEAAK